MTVTVVWGRSFFYVLDKNTYNDGYYGKDHNKNLIVAHQHHLLPPQWEDGGYRLSVRVTPQMQYYQICCPNIGIFTLCGKEKIRTDYR